MPDRPGVDNLVQALEVRRQAIRGFLLGALFAAATYYFFVVAPGGSLFDPYLLGLGLVLAFTLGLLATLVFTLVAAVRLNRRLD